jgi:hypothetical protein
MIETVVSKIMQHNINKIFINMVTANNMFPLQINFAQVFPHSTIVVLNQSFE